MAEKRTDWLLGLATPTALLVLWWITTKNGLVSPAILPSPSLVTGTLIAMARSGEMARAVAATLTRLGWGFIAGVLAGTMLGGICGSCSVARKLLDPLVQGLRSVPSLAWVPLLILWLGIFESSKITLIAIGVFFPVYLNLISGIANIDRKLAEVGQVHGYSRLGSLIRIQIPAALPSYVVGIRSGLGLGWMFVAAAELLGATDGLGFILDDGEQTGRPERVLAALLLFGICGKITDSLVALIGARMVAWQDTVRS